MMRTFLLSLAGVLWQSHVMTLTTVIRIVLWSGLLILQSSVMSAQEPGDPGTAGRDGFAINEQPTRLVISHRGKPVGEFVFADARILRPYFSNLHVPDGIQVTRNHPPVAGSDAVDHDTMHPGVWLAFGDINGEDFWRNKGRIEHLRFAARPMARGEEVQFIELSRLITSSGEPMGDLVSRFHLKQITAGWLLSWNAELVATERDLVFGDQEEMGLGARLATPLTENAGGRITSSAGLNGAAATWGRQAAWCDYSGKIDGKVAGITIFPNPSNPQTCWWHNRNYGVFVANPFGKRAGFPTGQFVLKKGAKHHLNFDILLHSGTALPDLSAVAKSLAVSPPRD